MILSKNNQSIGSLIALPLKNKGSLSQKFIARGCHDWNDALRYVNKLPYARTSNSNNFYLVLEEEHGTCSTKHALLAALAEEQKVPLFLMMGLMEMNATYFPALEPTLKKYGLSSVLETHCYLRYEDQRIDITFPQKVNYPKSSVFLKEWMITPQEIGDQKIKRHQEEMKKWITEKKLPYTFEEMWKIREECIDRLSVKN